jgi:tryptophan-rich sensory protein
LLLNTAWTSLFFVLQSPLAAFVDISLLWIAIVATVAAFGRVKPLAATLLMPYLLWVSFAWTLNLAIWRMNP